MGNLTVRESLRYAAMLRLSSKIPLEEKMRRVDTIMEELGLAKSADTKVGISGIVKGISGGERKRLCIGIELLTEPSVLFLDEPTTGKLNFFSSDLDTTLHWGCFHSSTLVLTHSLHDHSYNFTDPLFALTHSRSRFKNKLQCHEDNFQIGQARKNCRLDHPSTFFKHFWIIRQALAAFQRKSGIFW